MPQRRLAIAALIVFGLTSMACSLGGSAVPTTEPTGTTIAEQPSTRISPTVPPVAPSETPTKAPPTAIPPTETPTGSGPGGCILNEQFVADVTIPDGTVLAPSSAFVKTWRVKNTGTCNWENYQLIFATGEQMSGPASVAINNTQ